MHFVRLAAVILAIVGGYLGLSAGSASAMPLGSGALPAGQTADRPLVQQTQYFYVRRGYRRGYGGYRRGFRPRYYGYRPIYRGRPRVVCRTGFVRTYYGVRRVRRCFRRW